MYFIMSVIVVFCNVGYGMKIYNLNMFKVLQILVGCGILNNAFADDVVTLNQQQLQETQKEIVKQGNTAIDKIPQTKKELSSVNLNNLDLSTTKEEINQAQPYFNNVKSLSNKLPNGNKYYLFSESIVSDSSQTIAQYKNSPLDINQTISDYNAMLKNAKTKIMDNRLLIFISASMPKKTIVNLMNQGSSLGAIFVVRGLIQGSYVKTYRYFYQLKGDNNVGVMINPTMFKAFDITSVPTFALYQSSQDLMHTACNITPNYTKVSGEVSIDYALTQLKSSHITDLAQIANNELDALEASNFYKGKSIEN
jgi:conjugal transfer pilus assembly protein TrbC